MTSPSLCLLSAAAVVAALVLPPLAHAASADEMFATTSTLTELEVRAAQAEPRERCFLYTELLHDWTELAGRSLAIGDEPAAALAMQHADADALHLHEAISHDSKRLKNAELLVERSVHRLSDMLRASPMDQHDTVQAVLRHVSTVHDDLLAAVFAH